MNVNQIQINRRRENTSGEEQRTQKSFILGLMILIIFAALCYKNYWGNVWYLQDDYSTVEIGGEASIWDAGGKITSGLYQAQRRYQPVRLYLFSIATHLIPEEYSFFYNFGLHLANITLLFLLLRTFRIYSSTAFIVTLLFSTYGVFKMMESPSAMIGGSGLNAFFMLAAFWLLTSGLQSPSSHRKYASFIFSYLSYLGLVFSYEVAFPMLTTIIFGFLFFNVFIQGHPLFSLRRYVILVPYLVILIFFYLLFYQGSPYEGAQVNFSLGILTRFLAYSKTLLDPFTQFTPRWEVFLALLIYYPAILWILKQNRGQKDSNLTLDSSRTCFFLFFFGLLWYFSSVLLFILNHWQTPTSVMHHHLYLMTIGTTLLIMGVLFSICHLLIPPAKKIFTGFLIFFLVPFFLIHFLNFNLRYGEESAEKAKILFTVKKQIQKYVPDVHKVDAIILKNFLKPHGLHYYQISHLNGAFLQWFFFKKYVESGADILSTCDGKITFKGPLSYYDHIFQSRTITLPENKIELFYYDSQRKRILTYGETIDFVRGINLHQADQVRSSMDTKTDMGPLKVVLRNFGISRFLTVEFQEPIDPLAIRDKMVMALNDEPVREVYHAENSIILPLSSVDERRKYVFLQLDFPEEPELIPKITRIDFQNSVMGTKLSLPKSALFDFQNYTPRYRIGSRISFTGQRSVEFINWYDAESTHMWARGKKGIIYVHFENLNQRVKQYALILKGSTLGAQEMKIRINGFPLVTLSSDGQARTWEIPLPAKILEPNAINIIEFEVPGAKKPGTQDERTLGFALQELKFISVHPPSPVAAGK